jgi:hypothetical protein
MPVERLPAGELPRRSPRGYVGARIHGTAHLARRGRDRTLCGVELVDLQRTRPVAVCLTCAASIALLS